MRLYPRKNIASRMSACIRQTDTARSEMRFESCTIFYPFPLTFLFLHFTITSNKIVERLYKCIGGTFLEIKEMNEYSFFCVIMETQESFWGDMMFVKKTFAQETVGGVQIAKGSLSFQGVRLTVYCFATDRVLIDTGAASLAKEFTQFFKSLDIEQVMITHFHEDHTGCAAFLQNERQLPIFMNEIMIDYCRKKPDYPMYRKFFWGKRPPFQAAPIGTTFSSRHATWDVIDAPGHSIDHLAFLNRETGQLFTGDLYCQEKTKVMLREESLPTIIHSLKKVLTYDFHEVFCAHAGYIKDGRAALQRKLAYLLEIQEKIIHLYEKGMTPKQIQATLFPKKYPITVFSLGEWDSLHIVHSVIQEHMAQKAS